MSALNGLGSSPTLAYYMTMTSSVAQNTHASSPWRTERYNKILRSCLTWSQAFLLWNKCMLVQIVVSLVNGRPGAQRFTYSPVLQDFTKATNIRLTFLRTNTLLGHLISKAQRDPTVTRRVSRAHDLTQTCRPAIRLSSFLESRFNFQFFFLAVLLQYQRHQRRWTLCLPRPCSCVRWGQQPGQNKQVHNTLKIFAPLLLLLNFSSSVH